MNQTSSVQEIPYSVSRALMADNVTVHGSASTHRGTDVLSPDPGTLEGYWALPGAVLHGGNFGKPGGG